MSILFFSSSNLKDKKENEWWNMTFSERGRASIWGPFKVIKDIKFSQRLQTMQGRLGWELQQEKYEH